MSGQREINSAVAEAAVRGALGGVLDDFADSLSMKCPRNTPVHAEALRILTTRQPMLSDEDRELLNGFWAERRKVSR